MMMEVRKSKGQPLWMGDAAYAKLSDFWRSPNFEKKSEQAKLNRNEDAGACMHTTGSKPHSVVWLEMVILTYYYYKFNIITLLNTYYNFIKSKGEQWRC